MKTKARLRPFIDACLRLGVAPASIATGSEHGLLDSYPCPWSWGYPPLPSSRRVVSRPPLAATAIAVTLGCAVPSTG